MNHKPLTPLNNITHGSSLKVPSPGSAMSQPKKVTFNIADKKSFREDEQIISINTIDELTASNVVVVHLQAQLKETQAQLKIQNELEQTILNQKAMIEESEKARTQLQNQVEHINLQRREDVNKYEQKVKDLTQQMYDQEKGYQNKICDLEMKVQDLTLDLQKCKTVQDCLEATVLQQKDQLSQQQTCLDSLEKIQKQNKNYLIEITSQHTYLKQLEDKMYKANVTSLELLRTLKNTEAENEALKCYIIDLKQKVAIYVPEKDDVIDRKLSVWINKHRTQLKVMFLRESSGVYTFGSKKVAVKLEGKDQLKVKVGAQPFIPISDFIDQFSQSEFDKIDQGSKKLAQKENNQQSIEPFVSNKPQNKSAKPPRN